MSVVMELSYIFLTIIIVFEFATHVVYKTSTLRQIIIFYKVKPKFLKLIKGDWYYYRNSLFDSFTISKIENNRYEFLLEIRNHETFKYTNGKIYMDKQGNILKEEITESINYWDTF